jgi:hypothetical protein
MPDWQRVVRRRLAGLALDAAEKEEVHRELAAHLEESYEAFCKEGLSEKEAIDRAMEQVSNWQDLQRKIFFAKRKGDLMQKRMHQLWIPGFLTLILSTVLLMALQKLGYRPRIVGSGPGAVFVYLPWLASLPAVGALGAYLSSRAGASRPTACLASIFPVLALTAAFLSMFPIGLVVEHITGSQMGFGLVATALLRDGMGWLLVPGAALFVGGLLVDVLFSRRRPSEDATVA